MCCEVIKNSKINEVVYILDSDKEVNYKLTLKKSNSQLENEFSDLIKKFFKNIRNNG